jgi:hypothetical protein
MTRRQMRCRLICTMYIVRENENSRELGTAMPTRGRVPAEAERVYTGQRV